jgi:phosphatidylethanolamine/phosphatidyl-N-methylethanolamine N-methyltransferase
MNNSWNKIIYKIWSPFYDKIFNSGAFLKARKKIFQDITFKKQQKILFVGVGTGADLDLITQTDLEITAVDFSPDMLNQAKTKFKDVAIQFLEMDAQNMTFDNETFDYVVASLILSVVSDADKCFMEMNRVLKKDGKLIVFDKFVSKDHQLSLPKKILRPLIKILGTDIGLNFEDLYLRNNIQIKIVKNEPVMMNGMYKKIILTKC